MLSHTSTRNVSHTWQWFSQKLGNAWGRVERKNARNRSAQFSLNASLFFFIKNCVLVVNKSIYITAPIIIPYSIYLNKRNIFKRKKR